MRSYTLKEIYSSYNPKADDHSIIYRRVLRPVSFYLTYATLKAGITRPNQATFISFLLGLASMLMLMEGGRGLFSLGVIFYVLYLIYDYVDGNIARITDTASYYGKYLDGVVDVFVEVSGPLAVSIGYYAITGNRALALAGIGASVFLLFSFFLINRTAFYTRLLRIDEMEGKVPSRKVIDRSRNPFKSRTIPLTAAMNFSKDLRLSVLCLAIFTGMNDIIFVIFIATTLIFAVPLTIASLAEARVQINVHRVSKLTPSSEVKT